MAADKKTLFETDVWEPVPMIDQRLIDEGWEGGEGCQACAYIISDPIDGKLAFFGTDCAGLYKSTDGGWHWTLSTLGMVSCGAVGFAIDYNNINRVIMVGANTWRHPGNGIHLSTDAGDTWRYVYTVADTGRGLVGLQNDYRHQTDFDSTTYDEAIGGSAVCYWSREIFPRKLETSYPALYKSTDGGETWAEIPDSYGLGGGELFVNQQNGWLYVSVPHDLREKGVYRSKDGGKTFEHILKVNSLGMCITHTAPENIYVTTSEGMYVSHDCGDTWDCIMGEGYPTFNPCRMKVNPNDPDKIVLLDNHTPDPENCWGHVLYFTRDGGKTWGKGSRTKAGSWIPVNSWSATFHYSVNGDVLANGPYISQDDGEHYKLARAGFNGICVGGKFTWNVNHPNIMSFASQDFNGGWTLDYGKTWKYINWSGKGWGGNAYGSYAHNENDAYACVSTSWSPKGEIRVTHDGGDTVESTGLQMNGDAVTCGIDGHNEIGFLGEWRTDDCGYTFTKMENVVGVYAYDKYHERLYGKRGYNTLIVSDDFGLTWQELYAFPTDSKGPITDIAVNGRDGYIHVIAGDVYYRGRMIDFPSFDVMNYPSILAKGICVDPIEPSIVYIGCTGHTYHTDGTLRSLDNGETFTALNRHVGDGRKGAPAGFMAGNVRVNPETRELFVAGGCRGIWKLPPPPKK